MIKRYLTEAEINEMAHAALCNYEYSCEWKKAFHAACEYAIDELGVRPTKAQAATATNKAKAKWEQLVITIQMGV